MALGHRLQTRNILWPLAICTVLIMGVVDWKLRGPDAHLRGNTVAVRYLVENITLAHEDAVAAKDKTWWQSLLAQSPERNGIWEMAEHLKKSSLMSDALRVDFALIYDQYAKVTHDPVWTVRAEKELSQVVRKKEGSYYFAQADALLHPRKLTPEETKGLEELCRQWPSDWWVAQLARANGLEDRVDRIRLLARGKRASLQMMAQSILLAVMVLGGLVLIWPWWRAMRRLKFEPAIRHGDGLRHLRRLWSGAPALLCFALSSLLATGLAVLSQKLAPHFLPDFWNPTLRYWWWVYVWLMCSITTTLVWPIAAAWCMAPECGGLRRVFDLRHEDFFNRRWWFLGVAGSLMLFVSLGAMNSGIEWMGFRSGESDSLSRSFGELGPLAFPVAFLWGAVLAPWTEELMFRGFLFTALKNQFGFGWGAALSSLVFAVPHFYGWVGTLDVFLMGMTFCFVYQRTHRLAASMILHSCINAPLTLITWLEWSA